MPSQYRTLIRGEAHLRLMIVQVGQVDTSALIAVQKGLTDALTGTCVGISEAIMPLLVKAYDAPRQQYRSTPILAMMTEQFGPASAERLLGVTEADLYAPGLNFVFGEAESLGTAAIISLFRLKPTFYGQSRNDTLFYERAIKEAVHEVGHTLGLPHCKDPLCVMFFSNNIQMTDAKRSKFCQRCGKLALAALRELS
jgi:archaemetzincin